jgi:sirohydrochlorin ferrochelatase
MRTSAGDNRPTILLVDNGSLAPAATFCLRQASVRLSLVLQQPVVPVSLLHSQAIPAEQLAGTPAEILEPALKRRLREGVDDFLVVPFFLGPSRALSEYLPSRVRLLKAVHSRLRVRVTPPLVDLSTPQDERIASVLEERVRSAMSGSTTPPRVILVDHGSPTRDVTEVRNHLARQLQTRLGRDVQQVTAASMERRPGSEYAFNEPLLEHALDQTASAPGVVIVALLFLAPGKHAGPDGDVARICQAAEIRHPQLRIFTTEPVGSHPLLTSILSDRVRTGSARPAL